jgi:hypothetical protein
MMENHTLIGFNVFQRGTNPRLGLASYSCLKLGQTWNYLFTIYQKENMNIQMK